MPYLTRRFRFSASHRLHSDVLDASANAACYGLCENMHGHNYLLEVTVKGDVDPQTGFFCNVLDLKKLVDEQVVDKCEHQCLNELDLFQGMVTTMENIAQRIWQAIEGPLREKGMQLSEVQLGETDDHWVRIRGDE
jgi:6-pyruvoyltetrahydropterin/6-carboxytetrahydropterin synthase